MKPAELQKWRERHGMTQAELARALGVDVVTIGRWERGERVPPPYLYLALREIARDL